MNDLLGYPEAVLRLEQYSIARAGTWHRCDRKATTIAALRLRLRYDDDMAVERCIDERNSDAKLSSDGKSERPQWGGSGIATAARAEGGEDGYD
jgi:hypothetical protein